MRVVVRPPRLILRLRREYLLPHEGPHPGRDFLGLGRQCEIHSLILAQLSRGDEFHCQIWRSKTV